MKLFRFLIAIIIAAILSFSGIARADCIDPAGEAGRISYSSSNAGMEYCNGAEWIEFPKAAAGASCGNLGDWEPRDAARETVWNAVAYGNSMFVAVSTTGDVMTSVDGLGWTDQGNHLSYGTLTYGNGLFLFVFSGDRRAATSTDGINWTTHTNALPASNNWSDVVYGSGWFVAVSNNGTNRVARSPDGINWTAHSAVEASHWTSVTYGNGMFVAVSYTWNATHPIMTSTDGAAWTPQVATAHPWGGIAYGNGLFVVGGEERVMTSPDGVNWTPYDSADIQAGAWRKPVYGNDRFVLTSMWHGSNPVLTSSDGVAWSTMPSVQGNDWGSVAFGGGRFVAVSGNGTNRVMTAECESPGCDDPEGPAGRIMYNADHRVAQWCDGTTWHAMGPLNPTGPNDGCESPVKPAGNLLFNADYCILQYCDGDTWQGIGELNPCACKSETADLVGHWPLDEGSGLTASDASGNGNHGTLVSGPTWVVGHIGGGALSFDATNDRVVIANESNFDFDRTNAFTISTWLRQTGPTSHGIVGKWIGTPGYGIYGGLNGDWFDSQQCSGNCIIFGMQNASSQYMEVMVNNAVTLNTWTHVVATYDGSSARSGMRVYLNGVPATTVPIGQATLGGSILNNDAFRIGAFANSSVYYGRLDDARVYNRALTPAEVSSLYSNNSLCP